MFTWTNYHSQICMLKVITHSISYDTRVPSFVLTAHIIKSQFHSLKGKFLVLFSSYDVSWRIPCLLLDNFEFRIWSVGGDIEIRSKPSNPLEVRQGVAKRPADQSGIFTNPHGNVANAQNGGSGSYSFWNVGNKMNETNQARALTGKQLATSSKTIFGRKIH